MSPLNPLPEDAKISSTAAGSGKWMSSKMRLMRKLRTNTDMVEAGGSKKRSTTTSSNNNNLETGLQFQHDNDNTSRVCSDCSTTKTPLWRGGPRGPKSLCNACGIRQRKARKAMGVVAATSVMKQKGTSTSSTSSPSSSLSNDSGEKLQLQMQPNNIPFKKRCKILYQGSAEKKMTLDDLGITNLNRSSDVNEAAKLLMALSSDIICG